MEEYKISDFLEDYVKETNRGKCKACQRLIKWSKGDLASHKRASCEAASDEEKTRFAKKVSTENLKVSCSEPLKKRVISDFKISDFLQDYVRKTNRGQCKSCQKLIRWSREAVAAHKRASCLTASAEEKEKFNLQNDKETGDNGDTGNFKISDFLQDFVGQTNRGKCKCCQKMVKWSRENLAAHKRAFCTTVSEEEKRKFAKRSRTSSQDDFAPKWFKESTDDLHPSMTKKLREKVKVEKAENSEDSSDGSDVENDEANTNDNESRENFNSNNCYICNFDLSPFRYPLWTSTTYSVTPVCELLESFTGAAISEDLKMKLEICFECFLVFEKFDELQQQCKSIQNKLANVFHKTHVEKVFVKQEPEVDLSDEDSEEHGNVSKPLKNENWSAFEETFGSFESDAEKKLKNESDSKSFYCEECKKDLKTEHCLRTHLATDHDRIKNGPFNCPVCLKTTRDRESLRSHLVIHSERKYLCGRCGGTFVRKSDFKNHMQAHDGIRPFPCSFEGCDKRFRDSVKLKIHLRVHTGEKIFECPHCPGKRFAQKFGMDLHIKNHHRNETEAAPGEICKVCGIQTHSKAQMKAHLIKAHQVVFDTNDPMDEDRNISLF